MGSNTNPTNIGFNAASRTAPINPAMSIFLPTTHGAVRIPTVQRVAAAEASLWPYYRLRHEQWDDRVSDSQWRHAPEHKNRPCRCRIHRCKRPREARRRPTFLSPRRSFLRPRAPEARPSSMPTTRRPVRMSGRLRCLQARGSGIPMTYMHNGKQYVVHAAGGRSGWRGAAGGMGDRPTSARSTGGWSPWRTRRAAAAPAPGPAGAPAAPAGGQRGAGRGQQ